MARRNVNIINIKTKKRNKIYINSNSKSNFSGNFKGNKVYLSDNTFMQSLVNYIGQTITIYVTSGGESGSGFTGVLLDVKKDYIKVLSKAASPPECSLGNGCDSVEKNICDDPSLGIMTNILVDKIAAFVHNTV